MSLIFFMISVSYGLDCNMPYKNIDEVKINKEIKECKNNLLLFCVFNAISDYIRQINKIKKSHDKNNKEARICYNNIIKDYEM